MSVPVITPNVMTRAANPIRILALRLRSKPTGKH